jgi:uncharacterized protein (TIGR02246 family)
MKKHFVILSLVILCCLSFGCKEGESVAEAVQDVMTDMAALRANSDRFDEANNAGDAEGITSFHYTEDAVRMPPNEPMLVGRAAIQDWFVASFEQNEVQVDNVPLEAKVSGDLAFMQGVFSFTGTPKAGGEIVSNSGNWVAVYERQPDKSWKAICDIWVEDDTITVDPSTQMRGGVISPPESVDAEADIAAIRAHLDNWYAAYNSHDYEGLAALYKEDAVSISDDVPVLVAGREAILASFKKEMELYHLHVEDANIEDVRVSGNLGMARGIDTGTVTPKEGGDAISFSTKWVAIYARQDDGSWLCIREIGNSNLPEK